MWSQTPTAALIIATFFGLTQASHFSIAHAAHNYEDMFADPEIRHPYPSPSVDRITAAITIQLPKQTPYYTSTRTIKHFIYTTVHLPYVDVGHPLAGVPTHTAVPAPNENDHYDHDQIPIDVLEHDHIEMLRQYAEHADLRRRGGTYDSPLPVYDVPTTTVPGPVATGQPCAPGQSGCVAAPGAVSLVGVIVDGISIGWSSRTSSGTMTTATMTSAGEASATITLESGPAATSLKSSAVRESANAAHAAGVEELSRVAISIAVVVAVVGAGFA